MTEEITEEIEIIEEVEEEDSGSNKLSSQVDRKSDKEETDEKSNEESKLEKAMHSATSFDEMDKAEHIRETENSLYKIMSQGNQIMENIMFFVTDSVERKKQLKKFSSDFKKRLSSAASALTEEVSTEKESTDDKKVTDDIRPFMLWKDGDLYRFFAIYSNNFRDDDNPQEIISAKSHENFVKQVEDGNWPYPVLLHYHVDGTEWGQADWVSYSKETGFAMASGYILPGHEKEAEIMIALIESGEEIAMSHGMPGEDMIYSKDDSTVIEQHRTSEITDLYQSKAANKFTSFIIPTKEMNKMSIPLNKIPYLEKVGLSTERIDEINAELKAKQEAALAQGRETKEEAANAKIEEEVTTEEVITEKVVEETEETPESETVFSDSQVKELASAFELVTESLLSQVKEMVDASTAELKTLIDTNTTEREEIKEALGLTPDLSLTGILLSGGILQNFNASNSEQTKMDKRTNASKDGPEENLGDENDLGLLSQMPAIFGKSMNAIVSGDVHKNNNQ